jgi:cellobiose phosphorylase
LGTEIKTHQADQQTEFFNGFGGFANDGKEYEILLDGGRTTPAPWINVVANDKFGFFVSETGAGTTWAINSRENKITPWSNDPVCDKAYEAIYVKDHSNSTVTTPTALGRDYSGSYTVRHGFGYSFFYHDENDLKHNLDVLSPLDEPLKIWRLKLENTSKSYKRFAVTYYVEWALGSDRENSAPYIISSYNNELDCLLARNTYNDTFRKQKSFMFSNETIIAYTGDKKEFMGSDGSIQNPEGLNKKLSCNTGVGYDPCGVIQISVDIRPGESKTILFCLGQSDNFNEIAALRDKYKDASKVDAELGRIKEYWDSILGTVQVKTKDRAIDILVNGWLLYQTLSCRIKARSAFYQSGGAYGFRDQLQDVLALLYSQPEIAKRQILLACGRQFEEGDVQHWWHPPTGVGVRTKISDDLLWLPYVTAAYIKCTGDYSILKEVVPYIKGPLLPDDKREEMFTPEISENRGTVYEHCKKAILRTKFGEHGLPLMGGGDWNDGMNLVGIGGKGESVWLGWFLYSVLGEFISLCVHEEDFVFAEEQKRVRESLLKNIEEHAWDGEWYIRAFYDDLEKMGSKESDECKIDSISQSWSVISQGANKDRARIAVNSARQYLVNEKEGLSLLLYPPFDKTPKNPGYIKNYYPGVRENGGQYTHASVWLAIAAAMIEDHRLAGSLFRMLNPIHITSARKDALRYEKEPYVMAADIMATKGHDMGRGGWSWYTGAAGWMYQGLVKFFLGIAKENGKLTIKPSIPGDFGDYTVWYGFKTASYEIKVADRRNTSSGAAEDTAALELSVDGEKINGASFQLEDDGRRHLVMAIIR